MKKKLSLVVAMVLALAMVFSLAACGSQGGNSASSSPPADNAITSAGENENLEPVSGTSEETLKVCLEEEPACVLPLNANAGVGSYVSQCIYDTLIHYNSDTKELEPMLATEWEWVDDTHLKMTLRDDVVAYDGSTLTASDVLYSVQQGLAGDAPTQWKYVDGNECSAPDDTTFILGLKEAHPTVVNLLASICMLPIIDESSVEANGGYEACLRDPKCSTGAYKFEEWKNGEYIRLVRNEDYWGEAPYYAEITFTFINDSASRAMGLSGGDINVAADLTSADALSITEPNKVTPVATGGCYVIFFNVTNEYLSNATVREAIFKAIDVEALNQVGTTGLSTLASSLMPSSNAYYSAPSSDYDHTVDIEAAKQLLADAGYPDGFELYMPIMAQQQPECEVIQACLLQIGIDLKLEVVELPTYLGATDTGDFDLAYQRTTPDDIANMLNYFDDRLESFERGGGIFGACPDDIYELLDNCRLTTDFDEAMPYWTEFQDYVRNNYLYIPVYEDCKFMAMDSDYVYQYDQIGYINFATMRPAG